jgi:hypothetical protein
MGRPRDKYPDVCASHRDANRRAGAVRDRLGELDRDVLAAVIELTAGWSLIETRTSVKQIAGLAYGVPYAEVSGYQRDRVSAALRRLRDLGVVGYWPGVGHLARCTVSLKLSTQRDGAGFSPVNTARTRSQHSADAQSTQRDGWAHTSIKYEDFSEGEKPLRGERNGSTPEDKLSPRHRKIVDRLEEGARKRVPRQDWVDVVAEFAPLVDVHLLDAVAGQVVMAQGTPAYMRAVVPDWFRQRTGVELESHRPQARARDRDRARGAAAEALE